MIKRSRTACIAVAVILLAATCALHSLWLEAAIAVGTGLGWWARRARWPWAADGALAVLLAVAGRAVYAHVPTVPVVMAVVAALAAWDLEHFRRRLSNIEDQEQTLPLQRAHLQRLAVVSVVGGVWAFVALVIRVQLGAGLAVALGLLVVIGISQAVRYLKQAGQ